MAMSLCGQFFPGTLTRLKHEQKCPACDRAVNGEPVIGTVKCPVSDKCHHRFPDMKTAAKHSAACQFNTNEEEPS